MRKRSVTLNGHRTSVSLEPEFWEVLARIAAADGKSLNALVAEVDAARVKAAPARGLSSALRVFVLKHASGQGEHGPPNASN